MPFDLKEGRMPTLRLEVILVTLGKCAFVIRDPEIDDRTILLIDDCTMDRIQEFLEFCDNSRLPSSSSHGDRGNDARGNGRVPVRFVRFLPATATASKGLKMLRTCSRSRAS